MPDLEYIRRAIDEYDRIFFLNGGEVENACRNISENLSGDKRVLVIGTNPCPYVYDKFTYKYMAWEDAERLEHLYYTYEFTDNFLMIKEDSPVTASIFNFLKAGVLSLNEAWQVLLDERAV